jgi:hypothetical protein
MGEKNDDEEGHLRKRTDIEKEIRQRQESWRGHQSDEPQTISVAGDEAARQAEDGRADMGKPPLGGKSTRQEGQKPDSVDDEPPPAHS